MKKMNFDLNNLKVDSFKSIDTKNEELNLIDTNIRLCDRTFEPEFCTHPRICYRTRPPICPIRTTPATGCPTPTSTAAGCTRPPRCPRPTTVPRCQQTEPPKCRPTRFRICETRDIICR